MQIMQKLILSTNNFAVATNWGVHWGEKLHLILCDFNFKRKESNPIWISQWNLLILWWNIGCVLTANLFMAYMNLPLLGLESLDRVLWNRTTREKVFFTCVNLDEIVKLKAVQVFELFSVSIKEGEIFELWQRKLAFKLISWQKVVNCTKISINQTRLKFSTKLLVSKTFRYSGNSLFWRTFNAVTRISSLLRVASHENPKISETSILLLQQGFWVLNNSFIILLRFPKCTIVSISGGKKQYLLNSVMMTLKFVEHMFFYEQKSKKNIRVKRPWWKYL